MRIVRVGEQEFELPKYVYRVDDQRGTHGWQVRYEGGKFFSDSGAPDVAFERAKKYLKKVYDPNRVTIKRASAGERKLPVGISLRRCKKHSGIEYYFVCRSGVTVKEIYIGTEKTWTKNYDRKLADAEQVREELLSQFVKQKMSTNKSFKNSL